MNKTVLVSVITAVLALFVGFFGGMTYQKSKTPTAPNFAGLNQTNSTATQNGTANRNGFRGGNTPVSGKIIKIDSTSLTVQTADSSNKIVLVSDTTKVNKTSEASKTDLKEGDEIMVIGTTDSTTGSVTATTINLGTVIMDRPTDNPGSASK